MATKRLFLGNLNYATQETDIRAFFGDRRLTSIKLITDRDTGRSRGFGFVELDEKAALEAVESLNRQELLGRQVIVSEAKERERRPSQEPRSRDSYSNTWRR